MGRTLDLAGEGALDLHEFQRESVDPFAHPSH
jgi:hypothetical protein